GGNIDIALTPGSGRPPDRVRPASPANPYYRSPEYPNALEIEMSENWDYNDMTIDLRPGPDGVMVLTVLLGDQYERGGNVYDYRVDVLNSSGQPIQSIRYPDVVQVPSGIRCSYAINGHIDKFSSDDSNKVLMIEYRKLTADVIAPDGSDF